MKRQLLKDTSKQYIAKKIAILGGETTQNIKLILELSLLNYGIRPSFYESEYNQYYEDGMFPNPELETISPDLIYVCTCVRNITNFPVLSDDIETVEQKRADIINKFYGQSDSVCAIPRAGSTDTTQLCNRICGGRVMYQKYANSMPLYRQEHDWKQMGVLLNRATLANWIIYYASQYFAPFHNYLHRELLKRKFLMADETRIQVLHEEERKPETDSFMWLFCSGEDGLPDIVLYKYTETRAKFYAVEFLNGFQGYLETDCYQGYNNLPGIKRCCCFAHLRRYFVEAVPKGKELDYSNPATQGVQYINRLFEHERYSAAQNHSSEQRHAYRLEKEKPILEAFWKWISQQAPKKGTRFEKAVNYAQNHKGLYLGMIQSRQPVQVQCRVKRLRLASDSRVKCSHFQFYMLEMQVDLWLAQEYFALTMHLSANV